MSIQDLHDEIVNDPLTRGYSGMTDVQVVTSLNTINRTRNRTSMSGDEVFQATSAAEFDALSEDHQALWMSFCGRDTINPFGSANIALAIHIFGGGSTTLANLQSARVEAVSRATELGLGEVTEGLVIEAKAYGG